jgi:hypothetical protein
MWFIPRFRSKLKKFWIFLPRYQCRCWFTSGLLVVSIHDLRFAKMWKISSPHLPLPDYMLRVLITPNRVEELILHWIDLKVTCLCNRGMLNYMLIWVNPFKSISTQNLHWKSGKGTRSPIFLTLYLSHFQSLEWHAMWKERPTFWLCFPNWTGTKQTIKLITL